MFRLPAVLVAAVVLAIPTPAIAGEDGASLELRHRLCPTGYEGMEYEEDCTEVADPPLAFELTGPTDASGETDDGGRLTFTGLDPGDYVLVGGLPFEDADSGIICMGAVIPVGDDSPPVLEGTNLEIDAGEIVECEWYDIPLAMPDSAMRSAGASPDAALTAMGTLLLIASAATAGARAANRARVRRPA